jgi:hypothetical protein
MLSIGRRCKSPGKTDLLRIPSDADQRSEVMANTVPTGSRASFGGPRNGDRHRRNPQPETCSTTFNKPLPEKCPSSRRSLRKIPRRSRPPGEPGRRAISGNAPRQRWQSRHPRHPVISNLQLARAPTGSESPPLRQFTAFLFNPPSPGNLGCAGDGTAESGCWQVGDPPHLVSSLALAACLQSTRS